MHRPTWKFFFLDVGQGDAQVVVFPGGDALLIDGGGVYYSDFQVGKNILLPFLLQKRIHVRWVAVSHYHADHIRGITEIVGLLKPEALWLSTNPTNDPLYWALMAEVPDSTGVQYITAPTVKKIGGCTIQWLFPKDVITDESPRNNHSQVLKISSPYHSFLFTGDIEKEVEGQLVSENGSLRHVDVLKVPHHGSATSSHLEFLQWVSPQVGDFFLWPSQPFWLSPSKRLGQLQAATYPLYCHCFQGWHSFGFLTDSPAHRDIQVAQAPSLRV